MTTLACKTAVVDRRVGHLALPDTRWMPSSSWPSISEHPSSPRSRPRARGDDHELGCGVLGRSGTPIASWFKNESDLILAFGASFSNHTGIAAYKPIIQVDEDPMALGRFYSVDIPVPGNGAVTADLLREAISDRVRIDHRPEVAERWRIWREEKASRCHDDQGKGINAATLFATLGDAAPADAVICVDAFGLVSRRLEGSPITMVESGPATVNRSRFGSLPTTQEQK